MAAVGAPTTPKSLFDEAWRRYTPLRRRVEGSLSLTPQQAGTLQSIVQMWRKSASANYPPAMYQFGLALERGVAHTTGGRANDLVESFKWMKSAAARNQLEAMLHLADLYLKGEVPSRNNNDAPASNASNNSAATLSKRSESNAAGTSRLDRADSSGSNRSNGSRSSSRSRASRCSRSLSRDRSSGGNTRMSLRGAAPSSPAAAADVPASAQAEGLRWLRKAAQAGSADAAVQLGRSFMVGQPRAVLKPNQRKAFEYFAIAASKGNAIAQRNLGEFLWHGIPLHVNNQTFVSFSSSGVTVINGSSGSGGGSGSGSVNNAGYGTSTVHGGSGSGGDGIARTSYGAPKAIMRSVVPELSHNGRFQCGQQQQEPPPSPKSPCTSSSPSSITSSSYSLSPPSSPSPSSSADATFKLNRPSLSSSSPNAMPRTPPVAKSINTPIAATATAAATLRTTGSIAMAVPCDREAASKWFHLAAAQGDSRGCYGVGLSCEALATSGCADALHETLTPPLAPSKHERHYKDAFKWYLLAAERGKVAEAQCRLGYLLAEGFGIKRDLSSAAGWYFASAQQGYAEAQYCLGTLIDDFATENDHSPTSVGTPSRIDHDNVSSSNISGNSSTSRNRSSNSRSRDNNGSGGSDTHRAAGALLLRTTDSVGEASKWWRLAAQQQHKGAQLALGLLAMEDSSSSPGSSSLNHPDNLNPSGISLSSSGHPASRIAADYISGGNGSSCSGKGVSRDVRSSSSNSSDARSKGGGVKKQAAEAARWFQLAAEQGDADAQYHLACLYAEGHGCGRSLRASGQWMRAAAAQGHPEALLGLGELYEGRYHIDGTLGCFGLLPDENQAKHWYQRAAANAKPDFWDKVKATRNASRKAATTHRHSRHTNSRNVRNSSVDNSEGSESDYSSSDSKSDSDDGSPWNGIGCPGQVATQRLRRLRLRARRQSVPVREGDIGEALSRSPSGPAVCTLGASTTARSGLAGGTSGGFRPRFHGDDCGNSTESEEESNVLGDSRSRSGRRNTGSVNRDLYDWEVPSPQPSLPPPPPLPPSPSSQSSTAYPPSPVLMVRPASHQNQRGSDFSNRGSRKSIVRNIATPVTLSHSLNQGNRASIARSTVNSRSSAVSSITGGTTRDALSSKASLMPSMGHGTTRNLLRRNATPGDKNSFQNPAHGLTVRPAPPPRPSYYSSPLSSSSTISSSSSSSLYTRSFRKTTSRPLRSASPDSPMSGNWSPQPVAVAYLDARSTASHRGLR